MNCWRLNIFYFVNACSSIVYCYFSSTECIQIKQTPAVKQKHNPFSFLINTACCIYCQCNKGLSIFFWMKVFYFQHFSYMLLPLQSLQSTLVSPFWLMITAWLLLSPEGGTQYSLPPRPQDPRPSLTSVPPESPAARHWVRELEKVSLLLCLYL